MNIIQQIRETISSIVPLDKKEEEHLHFTKKWIDSGTQIFRLVKPSTPDPHLVSYFLLLDSEKKKVLLVDHINAGLWLPSGGHVEPNEHPKETAKREILEELNVEAEFLLDDPFFLTVSQTVGLTAGHTDISLWYLLKGSSEIDYCFDKEEFNQIGWFSFKDVPYDRSDPHMQRCLEKLKTLNQL